jgi:hypothetical protein
MSSQSGGSIVSASTVTAAGLASAGAATVTSSFGVAGTILGAALTTMIITGGSAILKAYLESATGKVRTVPDKLRARRASRFKADRSAEPGTMPGRPDLRDNFAGRMRAALGWFSHLSPLVRRSILIKGLIAAAIAFIIGMGVVYAMERGIGNSLSCGLWGKCPEGATPGINGGETGTGASSTLSLGRPGRDAAGDGTLDAPARQQGPGQQQDVQPTPSGRGSDDVDSGEPGPLQRLQDLAEPAPGREPDSQQQDPVRQRPSPNQQNPGSQQPVLEQPDPERPSQERPSQERPVQERPSQERPAPSEEPEVEEPEVPAQPGDPADGDVIEEPAPEDQ